MRALVLVNAGAGSVDDTDEQAAEIIEAFADAGGEAEVAVVAPEEIDDTIRGAWADADRPDVIVVAGGDGTVNGAAAVAVDTDIVISVLPLGTFNHFAKDLGIPTGLAGAAEAIVGGEVRRVDVAEVNGEVFVNNSAIGVYPSMVAIRDEIREARGWGKVRAVPVACARVLRNLPTHRFDLTAGERRWQRLRTPFLFIGNGRYDNGSGGPVLREDLLDGVLGVVIARTTTRRGLVATALRALASGAGAARDLEEIETPELVVSGRARRVRVARDGEVGWLDLPLRYRCRPGALLVRCPAVEPEPVPSPEDDPADPAEVDRAIADGAVDLAGDG